MHQVANQSIRRKGGAHRRRKHTSAHRVALATLTATAVSLTGAHAAAAQDSDSSRDSKASSEKAPAKSAAAESLPAKPKPEQAPTLVTSPQIRPLADMSAQLATALQYNKERVAKEREKWGPSVVIPALGTLTSGFGPRWGSFHYGVDIANVTNTPILAVMDGTVIDSGPASGYGQWIRILHDNGAVSVYGHLETLGVQVGERVKAGDQIGGMGNRGFSTGTHLHFEIHPDGTTPVDPVAWFLEQGLKLL